MFVLQSWEDNCNIIRHSSHSDSSGYTTNIWTDCFFPNGFCQHVVARSAKFNLCVCCWGWTWKFLWNVRDVGLFDTETKDHWILTKIWAQTWAKMNSSCLCKWEYHITSHNKLFNDLWYPRMRGLHKRVFLPTPPLTGKLLNFFAPLAPLLASLLKTDGLLWTVLSTWPEIFLTFTKPLSDVLRWAQWACKYAPCSLIRAMSMQMCTMSTFSVPQPWTEDVEKRAIVECWGGIQLPRF